MGKERETGIIINPKAGSRKEREKTLKTVGHVLTDAQILDLSEVENGRIKNIPMRLIIIGGDGTIRACLSWLASNHEYPEIFISGGGSTNTFRTALIEEGAKTSVRSFKEKEEKTILFKPAVIEHEDQEKKFWVISAGFGDFEIDFADAFEKVRKSKISHFTRAHTAGILALAQNFFSAMSSQEPLLKAYATSRRVGPFSIFSKGMQELSTDKLGLVEIEKKDYYWGILRFLLASVFWQMKAKSPKILARTKVASSFSEEIKGPEDMLINLDGDNKKIKPGKIIIKRHNQSFPVSALIWEKR